MSEINIKIRCPNCGKELGTLSWDLMRYYPSERNKNGKKRWFCNEECIEQYKDQFCVEIYKGRKIYFIERNEKKGYVPYWDCYYYFANIEDCMKIIDAPVAHAMCLYMG